MIKLNKNILQLNPSATLAINQRVKEFRHKGETVYHFGFGQSPFQIHHSISKALQRHAEHNEYLPLTGLPELKNKISDFLLKHQGLKFESNAIFIGPGSKELLFQIIYLLDGMFLIPKGSWVSYLPQIKSKGADYQIIETKFEDDFKVTEDKLRIACEKFPKIQKTLILNSPNNPTGAVYSNKELKALANVCKEHDVIVLSDEIYSQINFLDEKTASIASHYPEGTIVFGGLSKVFSAGGYRLGFAAIPASMDEVYQPLQSFFSETFSAVSSPIQYAALSAYTYNNDLEAYIKDCNKILSEISKYVYTELMNIGIRCTKPLGGFYMMIGLYNYTEKINNLGLHTSKECAEYLLNKHRIALLPASDFYFEPEEFYFRLAFVDFDGQL
ncbi:MAG: aminotransferase class I/II-fold pyridoxal phosphate-dependent enzyme, partial [Flavobacteriaceae bacterium]|nr:aminotransferase class I/II-fold pyridoxal phosphate-dependent enzyme [Flavobacteriaceae bacterium]